MWFFCRFWTSLDSTDKLVSQRLGLSPKMNQTDVCAQKAAARNEHHVLHLLHGHIWRNTCAMPRRSTVSACSKKICRFRACWGAGGAAHTARHEILKQVQKSRTPGGEGDTETDIPPRAARFMELLALISVVWRRADGLRSPESL